MFGEREGKRNDFYGYGEGHPGVDDAESFSPIARRGRAIMTLAFDRILLVDPSLFTAPYDAALSEGLHSNGLETQWATRLLRQNEEPELPPSEVLPIFYRLTDGPVRRTGKVGKILKGIEHMIGLRRLSKLAQGSYDVVHFQWSVLPKFDRLAIQRIRKYRPVVLTVHDTTPFNGKKVSKLQKDGFIQTLESADRLIVHTAGAKEKLMAEGISANVISVIPHGPLKLRMAPQAEAKGDRWRIVMFGKIQAYKGADLLIEAVGMLPPEILSRLEIVVAGEALIDLALLLDRIRQLGLSDTIEIRDRRHSDVEMATLLTHADSFVFPYREIEASGVLYMVSGLGKWLIASDLGACRDVIGSSGATGDLVSPNDPAALAKAIAGSIGRKPDLRSAAAFVSWQEIGAMTRAVYEDAVATHVR